MNKSIRKQFAFTLIELLVVIAIVGILSALIIVGMSSTTQKATIAKAQSFSSSVRNSLMSNLISEWKLEEKSASGPPYTTPDSWGTNNGTLRDVDGTCSFTGTLKCPQSATGCPSGNCFSFDGTDDYIQIAGSNGSTSNLAIMGAITLSAWVKFNNLGTYQVVAGRGRPFSGNGNYGYSLSRSSNNRMYFTTCDTTTIEASTYSLPIDNNNWHFVVGTWDGTINLNGKKVYVDGVLGGQGTSSFSLMGQPAFYFQIGADGAGWAPLNGFIDDVRIFDIAMPTSQIQQNYFAGINKLFAKNEITQSDYQQHLAELSNNYAKDPPSLLRSYGEAR